MVRFWVTSAGSDDFVLFGHDRSWELQLAVQNKKLVEVVEKNVGEAGL
jgi:hypothetical protein